MPVAFLICKGGTECPKAKEERSGKKLRVEPDVWNPYPPGVNLNESEVRSA